ncbi:MAG: hypothetical protein K2X77_02855 [Candidatus Obscuribacterales bacterium]|jgi:hypothetical protein|nr:hypothetical protein [Candidatus Obscuribacterales bacterium]
MKTDKLPKARSEMEEYARSEKLLSLPLPPPEQLREYAIELKQALVDEDRTEILATSKLLLNTLSDYFAVPRPKTKILSVRPLEVHGEWEFQTFGDYDTETAVLRLWMKTAKQKKTSAYGTFLNTLVHEFCHHLDVVQLEFPNTFHTRGFYERVAELYHHIQDTPPKKIVWQRFSDGTYAVDWAKTMRR